MAFEGTLEPIDTLRIPGTPKPGDLVDVDISNPFPYLTGSHFSMWPSTRGPSWFVGRVQAIKRVGDNFYYRVDLGKLALDVAFKDVILKKS